jgi:hypothetical protein
VKKIIDENDKLYTNNKQFGELYSKWENAFCGGRSKQPPAKMSFVLVGGLSNRQHKWHLCWRAA